MSITLTKHKKVSMLKTVKCWCKKSKRVLQVHGLQGSAQYRCDFSPPWPKRFSRAVLTQYHKPGGWKLQKWSQLWTPQVWGQGVSRASPPQPLGPAWPHPASRGCPLSWVPRGGGCSAFTPASVVWFLPCVCVSSLWGLGHSGVRTCPIPLGPHLFLFF